MRKILFGVISFCLFSCKGPSHEQECIVNVDPDVAVDVNLENVERTILMQDGMEAILGPVVKSVLTGEGYFILSQNRLMRFDRDGIFQNYISNVGRAANEYVAVSDFWIAGGNVFIYDMNGRKVLEYSVGNKLIDVRSLLQMTDENFIPFDCLTPFAGGYVGKCVWNGVDGVSPALAFYDSGYEYVRTLGDVTINCGLRLGVPLFGSSDEVLYWNALGNTVYSVDDELEVKAKYRVSFGGKDFPARASFADDYELLDLYENDKEWRMTHAGLVVYVWQRGDLLMFTYIYRNIPHLCVYNVSNGQTANYRINCGDVIIKHWSFDGDSVYVIGETDEYVALFKVWSVNS